MGLVSTSGKPAARALGEMAGDFIAAKLRRAAPVRPVDIVENKLVPITIQNPQRLWLTYETRFNWPVFVKAHVQLSLNLYRIPVECVQLVLADPEDLETNVLKTLASVFFPDFELAEIRKLGIPPWSPGFGATVQQSVSTQYSSCAHHTLVLARHAVLPYNRRDNTNGSQAMGTYKTSQFGFGAPLEPLNWELDMWCTASRSSVVRVVRPPSEPTPLKWYVLQHNHTYEDEVYNYNWAKMDFEQVSQSFTTHSELVERGGNLLWQNEKYATVYPEKFTAPDSGSPFSFSGEDFHETMFSVKCGIDHIGFNKQPGKARLETNSILACLRSSYIRGTERQFKYDSYADPHILILTEVMTVTEKKRDDHGEWLLWKKSQITQPDSLLAKMPEPEKPKPGDGFQVRSLRGMRHDREYFPPTSIPFVSLTRDSAKDPLRVSENSDCRISLQPGQTIVEPLGPGQPRCDSMLPQVDDPDWADFWERHYARALGRAKALLLLRYGLQGFGGNAQNFLLEMDKGIPTGRVVIRDMGDYALHDFILWALWNDDSALPPDPRSRRVLHPSEVAHALAEVKKRLWYVAYGSTVDPGKVDDLQLRKCFRGQLRLRAVLVRLIQDNSDYADDIDMFERNLAYNTLEQLVTDADFKKALADKLDKNLKTNLAGDFGRLWSREDEELFGKDAKLAWSSVDTELLGADKDDFQCKRFFAELAQRVKVVECSAPEARDQLAATLKSLIEDMGLARHRHASSLGGGVRFGGSCMAVFEAELGKARGHLDRRAQKDVNLLWQKRFALNPVLSYECDVLHALDETEYPIFTGYHRSGDHATFHSQCQNCVNASATSAAFVGHISPLWAYALPVSPQRIDDLYAKLPLATLGRFFEIEARWCLAHAKAWYSFIKETLGCPSDFETGSDTFPVNWSAIDPAEYHIKDDKLPYPSTREEYQAAKNQWSSAYEKMKVFEMDLGWRVENWLATAEGQAALRRYRDKH